MASLNACRNCSPAEDLHTSQDIPPCAHRARQSRRSFVWYLASWNVRTLLDAEGLIETARQGREVEVADERKIDQVVGEMCRYKIDVAALQETKWFGCEIYQVGHSMVLTAGRKVPEQTGDVRQRGEGVAIVLSGPAINAWKAGGSRWKAWSSRLVSASLMVGKIKLHVLSCYAPTFAASREEKNSFFECLLHALAEIPSSEPFVMLGDFNARVGSRAGIDDEWWHVRGPHGYGELNEAGKELLSFLSTNDATVCNTWFEKRDIHKQTWQHPKSKQWHCIDYVIMRKADQRKCLDVSVLRGADCNTDHRMLRAKVMVGKRKLFRRRSGETTVKRWDVAKLHGSNVDEEGWETTRGAYLRNAKEKLIEMWNDRSSVEDKWDAVKLSLRHGAEMTLGFEDRRQPDWFRESEDYLKPLFVKRNELYALWLETRRERDRKKHAEARRVARRAVRAAKDAWFQRKATEAERGRHSGKVVWRSIRDIQRGRRGLIPVRTNVVKNEDGSECASLEARQERWRRHFTKVLNVHTSFDLEEIRKARQRPLRPEMGVPPSEKELLNAIRKLRNGKAAGESGILPEMVKVACTEEEFLSKLLQLVHEVWTECTVPCDWRDAILVPIPKKGDLSCCDNWRGISLLDVVGKVVARVLQERLQKLAEDELPESQCGFRKNRSCADMIFTVRQLVEKSWEHESKAFFTFIDLKKAYDSVPREAMWAVLQKLGVPENTIKLIQSFHQDMRARIRLEGSCLEEISVQNGLRQGCCMAPVLFNLYTCVALERWLARVEGNEGVGLTIKYKYDEKLFRRYTRNASEMKITECQFADDTALPASTRSAAEKMAQVYQQTSSDFGLTVSIPKTKHMVTGRLVEESDKLPIAISGGGIRAVDEFPYLGSIVASSGRMDVDVDKRIAQASKAFGALRKAVFLDKNLSLATKRKIYNACVLSVLLYGAECWTPLRKHERRLNTFHHRCVRTILGISNRQQWTNHIAMAEVRKRWGDEELAVEKVKKRRLEWLGHLARMPNHRIPKAVLFSWLPQRRPKCGPRKRWRDQIRKDLKNIGVEEEVWYAEARKSRTGWRALYRIGMEEKKDESSVEMPAEVWEVSCQTCGRTFRREGDKKRHKCLDERRKPVCEQLGAVRCGSCQKWFRSKGGLAVHTCRPSS